jgi:hypothetical protein
MALGIPQLKEQNANLRKKLEMWEGEAILRGLEIEAIWRTVRNHADTLPRPFIARIAKATKAYRKRNNDTNQKEIYEIQPESVTDDTDNN